MGYGTRGKHNQIKTFWPDDTDTEFYIEGSATLSDILARCAEKWPDASCHLGFDPSNIKIESKFIQTDCITYDLMDWGDYTYFLCISRTGAE